MSMRSPEGDTRFPPIDATLWREVARSDHPAGPQDEAASSYVTYLRAERARHWKAV